MSRQAVRGTIRSRLLVNALVDPDEAAGRLPAGVRPHAIGDGTIVGCCLVDVTGIRADPLPVMVGTSFLAAAHRISVEWDDDSGATTVGVYVPLRLTHSRAAVALGGRVFPGVHRRASIQLTDEGRRVKWSVEAGDSYSIRVDASTRDAALSPCEPIGATCLRAEFGLSPRHDGRLEAARMTPSHRQAHLVEIDRVESAFLAGFTSAVPVPSYLVRDVDVTWSQA